MSATAPSRRGDLVERDEHMRLLGAALGRTASTASGGLVLIEGPAGVGKSSLLDACRAAAPEHGLRALTSRGSELERAVAHGLVRQLLERAVAGADERDALLSGPAARAAETVLTAEAGPHHAQPGDSEFATLHGLYWLTANLAEREPLLLVADDGHWADATSLRFLAYLAGRLADLPVLVVVATRPDEPGAEHGLLAELAAAATDVLVVEALSAAGSAQVVRHRVGAHAGDELAQACHAATGGNPFLLHALLDTLPPGTEADGDVVARIRRLGPKGISRSIMRRIARLPDGAADLARAVAVLGSEVELRDAAALAELPLDRAADLADALAGAGVLTAQRPLEFIHPVVLEAVAADLGPGGRTLLHARAATMLHDLGAPAERVALHLSATGPVGTPWAVGVLRDVARTALGRGAPETAARHLRRACDEEVTPPVRGLLLAELGEAEWLAGEDPFAIAARLTEALDLLTDVAAAVQASLVLARVTFSVGDVPGAAAVLERAIDRLTGATPAQRLRMEAELGSIGLLNLSANPRVEGRLRAADPPPGDSAEELLHLCNFAVLHWMDGLAEPLAATSRQALRGGRLLAAETSDSIAFHEAVWILAEAEHTAEARAIAESALAEARARGSAFGYVASCTLAAKIAWCEGDLRECEAHARAGLALPTVPLFLAPTVATYLGLVLVERGELDEAEQVLTAGFVGPHLPDLAHMNPGLQALGRLRLAQGRVEDALRELEELGVRYEEHCHVRNPAVAWRLDAADACLRLDRPGRAREHVDTYAAQAERWGTPGSRGRARLAAARLHRGDERETLAAQAVDLLRGSTARLDLARALLELGATQRRAGRRSDATKTLTEAMTAARACGALRLAEQAHEELATAGAAPRALQFSGAESLTASERRVARMAAEGLSNPQIAQALFVTAKTVENHLGRAYVKLGIRSRAQLAGALAT